MRRLVTVLLALALFGVVVGLKFDVVHRFGSDMPIWDQWDAEGATIFVPWAHGELTIAHFFRPHNEHRIALTRLLALTELVANGQWDARLQCMVNAGLHALFGVVLFFFGRRLLGAPWSGGILLLLAALIGLPISWENLLSGFHSQQYFLLLFSFGVIALLTEAPPWSLRWWAGVAAGILALFSMASGLLAAVAAVLAVGARAAHERHSWRRQWPTTAIGTLLIIAGAMLLVHHPGHERLMARDIGEFSRYVLHSLEWPFASTWAAPLLWAPLAATAFRLARRPADEESAQVIVLVALGGWVLAQIAASAYARGADGGFPASRYVDTLAFGLFVNGLAACWLYVRTSGVWRLVAGVCLLGWVGVSGYGVERLVHTNYVQELPTTHAYYARCTVNVRAYLATGDPSHLRGDDFPYPNAVSFRDRLDEPALRAIFPMSIRFPLRLQTVRGDGVLHEVDASNDAAFPARHWTSHGGQAGTWESVVLDFPQSTALLFRFPPAPANTSASRLEFRDTRLGATIVDVLAARTEHDGEISAIARLPAGTVQLRAQIDDSAQLLAFEGPVEVARLSDLAARLAALGRWLALVSGIAAVLLLAAERALARR